jgi:uncharacterized Ntn-hydrolase superfamily protein
MAVGNRVPVVRVGVGAVASQSSRNPKLGVRALDHLGAGLDADQALRAALVNDEHGQANQLLVVDWEGRSAAFTGSKAPSWSGHIVGVNFAAGGNLLTGANVLEAMAEAYQATNGDLAQKLAIALAAGEAAGGDRRGRQSAALYVSRDSSDIPIDLRVDDHGEPVTELRRLLSLYRDAFPQFALDGIASDDLHRTDQ